jgi:2-polyprenyl-3-methyl-5-hydroxy-6-metoxy-1,4-benzoquinol methylase
LAQQDRLFGALGSWNFKRCANRECRLIWLDPMPLASEIGKAYGAYYTHDDPVEPAPSQRENVGVLRKAYRRIKNAYLAAHYGYGTGGTKTGALSMGELLYLLPPRRIQVDLEVRCLHAVPGGRLLDLGCGSGMWLSTMRDLGWRAEGVDFDPAAAAAAAARGLAVRCGSLERQGFPDATFDAITMSHVVEHLPDPLQTLTECARILKPGGKLIVWTPNASSLGRGVFKQSWRGLEPPRHLHLFSPQSMCALLERAGFSRISIRTRNSRFIWQQSYLLSKQRTGAQTGSGGKPGNSLAPSVLALMEAVLLVAFRDLGEWLDVQASRGHR